MGAFRDVTYHVAMPVMRPFEALDLSVILEHISSDRTKFTPSEVPQLRCVRRITMWLI